jgi:hypothetical protein
MKQYRKNNKDKFNEYHKRYMTKKKMTDELTTKRPYNRTGIITNKKISDIII